MKKHVKLLALLAIALVALCVFAACNTTPSDGTQAPETESQTKPQDTTPESESATDGANTDDSTPPSDEVDPGLNENGKYLVRFMAYATDSDPNEPHYEIFCDVEVAPGGRARPDGRPSDIRGWEWAMKWDKELNNVQQGMVVYAEYTKLQDYYVTFVDYEGNEIADYTKILKYDGERIDADKVPTLGKVMGKYFAGWSLVDSKDATATAETVTTSYTKGVSANMILKAYYADCTAIAPFVKEEIVVDGYMDPAYQSYSKNEDGTAYINSVPFFIDTTGNYVTDGGSGDDKNSYKNTSFWKIDDAQVWPGTSADTYVIWDGDWIYFMSEVTDTTLGTRSSAYIINTPNAYQNDTVEFWYNFEQNFTEISNKMKVGIDAFGLRQFGTPDNQKHANLGTRSMSWWFKYIQVATSVQLKDGTWTSVKYNADKTGLLDDKDQPLDVANVGTKFRVEIAIPALTEPTVGDPDSFGDNTLDQVIADGLASGHKKLEAYDVLRICLQSNDVTAWTEEDAEGKPVGDENFYSKHFAAGGRTQYYYPVYDSISLAKDGDYTAQ